MDLFSRKVLNSTQFESSVAKFIFEKVEAQAAKVDETKNEDEVPFFFLPPTTLSSEASAELEKRRHGKKNWDVKIEWKYDLRHNHRHEHRKHPSSSGSGFLGPQPSSPPSNSESFLTRVSRGRKICEGEPIECELHILQTVKKDSETASGTITRWKKGCLKLQGTVSLLACDLYFCHTSSQPFPILLSLLN